VRVDDYKYRFIDQPEGWLGGTVKPDVPILTNLRLDPYERAGFATAFQYFDWFKFAFWRFVFVQEVVMKFGETFIEYPPVQKPASFNLEAVKEQLKNAMLHHAQ
jgi:arylsulfatase